MKVIIFILAITFLIRFDANSCSCSFKPTVEDAVNKGDFIFSCVVLGVITKCYQALSDSTWRELTEEEAKQEKWLNVLCYYRYRVRIKHFYKGTIETKEQFVETPVGSTMCEFPFKIGDRYIVYSNMLKYNNVFYTDRCDRTMKYELSESRCLRRALKQYNR